MANYKGRIKVTQGIFDAVKICLKSGNSVAETARFMKLSQDVVRMMRDAETLDEYRAIMAAKSAHAKQNKQVAAIKAKQAEQPEKPVQQPVVETPQEVRHSVQVQATRYMEELMRKQTELLTAISNKLAYIVDELTGTGTPGEEG